VTVASALRRPGPLEGSLRTRRDAGAKLLVPYLMAGMTEDWVAVLQAVAAAGADAIEVGLPFSDPMIDGPVIQAAGLAALGRGTTVHSALEGLRGADAGVPLVVMTYYNLVFRSGHRRFAARLVDANVAGAIVPDLSLEELDPWAAAAEAAGIETVLMVAPSTPAARATAVARRSRGFLYAVTRMGVTGERAALGTDAVAVLQRVRAVTDLPVLAGIGISTPEQAREACLVADGVIVGSALTRRLLDGGGPEGAAAFVGELREAIGP
jgi:tryptophan synthase alpha chain